jgi:hypothetical protein
MNTYSSHSFHFHLGDTFLPSLNNSIWAQTVHVAPKNLPPDGLQRLWTLSLGP